MLNLAEYRNSTNLNFKFKIIQPKKFSSFKDFQTCLAYYTYLSAMHRICIKAGEIVWAAYVLI